MVLVREEFKHARDWREVKLTKGWRHKNSYFLWSALWRHVVASRSVSERYGIDEIRSWTSEVGLNGHGSGSRRLPCEMKR